MTFAFDLDGTLTAHPKSLGAIMLALRSVGHRVLILTAVEMGEGNRTNRLEMINRAGLDLSHYDELICVETGHEKGVKCRELGICLMVDNYQPDLDDIYQQCKEVTRLRVC